MKVVTIVGARPQFIKAAAVSRSLRREHQEVLVHTGQHYDYEMSGAFFDGLELPPPDVNLGVGSRTHGAQTAAMLSGIEEVLLRENPDFLLIYGDTNSTLAGALAASKLSIPIAHVEAGLRSFNRRMPEEINRVVADHLSGLLFCPSETAVEHLGHEGITSGVHLIGDVMLDVLNWAKERLADQPATTQSRLGLSEKQYILATIHRSENTDTEESLRCVVDALNGIHERVIFPVHPRTRKAISQFGCELKPHVELINPVNYLEMVSLVAGARMILTDSGGVQKEAYWLSTPCLTLRGETEWVETVSAGWNLVVGADAKRIHDLASSFKPAETHPALYGDGRAAEKCVEVLAAHCGRGQAHA